MSGVSHTPASSANVDRTNPDYNVLVHESVRLATFHDWPTTANVTPVDLAREGFYYTGVSDRVQCVFCRNHLRNWAVGDVPSTEHRNKYPNCPFVQGVHVNNVKDLAPSSSTRSGSARETRLHLHSSNNAQQQNQTESAHQEEYSASSSQTHSSVISSTGIKEPGQTYGVSRREIASRMDTPTVQRLIEMGYQRETISTAIQQRMVTTGDDFPNMSDLLKAVLELEDSKGAKDSAVGVNK